MKDLGPNFIRANPEPAEVIPVDFRGGREYRINMGRVALLDWHRMLRKHGTDPDLRERYERSLDEIMKVLDTFEFQEAQSQAYSMLYKELEEK